MKEFYEFNTEQEALSAESAISSLGEFPIIGRNAKTGDLEPDKQLTLRWAEPKKNKHDKWVFPRVPKEERDKHSKAVQDKYKNDHPHKVVNYSDDWFPVIEMT